MLELEKKMVEEKKDKEEEVAIFAVKEQTASLWIGLSTNEEEGYQNVFIFFVQINLVKMEKSYIPSKYLKLSTYLINLGTYLRKHALPAGNNKRVNPPNSKSD